MIGLIIKGKINTKSTRGPSLIHKWNNLTVHYVGLIPPPRPHHLN